MPDLNELIKLFLHERDVPCPVCKYNLRGLATAKCPECGSTVTIEIKGKEPIQSGWLIAAFGWSGLGFACLFSAVAVGIETELRQDPLALGIFALFAVGTCAVSYLLLRRPAWFFRIPAWRRWPIALAPLLLTTAAVIMLVISPD